MFFCIQGPEIQLKTIILLNSFLGLRNIATEVEAIFHRAPRSYPNLRLHIDQYELSGA